MNDPAQGEIWWTDIADTGRRPSLVVTRNAAIPALNAILVAPVTKTVRGIPTEVPLGIEDGLKVECAASFDNLRLVPRWALTERAGRLSSSKAHLLCQAMRAIADC